MNSQNINSINNSDFSHYAESAEKMEKISHFFNSFFWIHIAKAVLYFSFMPGFIPDYSSGAIDIIIAYIVSQIALTFTASYKEIYMNKTKLSSIAIAVMALIDMISMIAFKDYIISAISIIAIINEIKAQIKTFDLRKLKPLKGYPLFSELLDNPKYIFTPQQNANASITSISLNASPFANANQNNKNASHISIKIPQGHNKNKSHISVKIPPLNMPEPEKISVEDMSAEKTAKNNLFEIPLPADTPMEARLLGNATLDYREFQINNLQVEELRYDKPDESHKKINLSKDKK